VLPATSESRADGASHAALRRRDGDGEAVVRRLVAEAQHGDRDAMRELYLRYAPGVRAYVGRIVGDRDDADDVTQQIFAKLLTQLPQYQPGRAPFRAWVLRVARNVAIDHLRRRRSFPCEEVHGPAERVDEAGHECRASLREALSTLPSAQRDVVLLRHLVGLTPDEVAARLGRTVKSVHGLDLRGRAAARTALHELQAAPATVERLVEPGWKRSGARLSEAST
jgi:RNA polymerase sigma-70 factor (ECF subfamily)